MKMEAQEQVPDGDAHEIQVVCIGDSLGWIKQEPKEIAWEVQEKQVFLKGTESPHGRREETKVFPSSFEEVASACKWLTKEWGIQPTPILRGQGRRASGEVHGGPGVTRGFRSGTDALVVPETDGVETQRQRFRCFSCPEETGGLHEVYGQLRDLCHRWLKPERHSKEQILELVILEQFMTLLPQDVQSWVRGQDPETCAHVIALAEDFLRRQSEAKRWEQENEEPFVEVMVESPEAEDIPLDVWQRPLPDESPLERGRKARLLGGCRTPEQAERDGPGGNSEASELRQMSPEEPHRRLVQRYESFGEQPTGMTCGRPPVCVDVAGSGLSSGRTIQHLCPECGQTFQHKSTLNRHQKIHSGERPHVCLECGKAFRRRDKLIRHQQIHTGHKPHGCPECGKRFRERGKLVNHQRIHTGERPYACRQCGKAFVSKDHLVSHHRIHTGEKPHECPECRQRFGSKQSLGNHCRVHTGEKDFHCQDCGRVFHYISNFTKHQRIHAREGVV